MVLRNMFSVIPISQDYDLLASVSEAIAKTARAASDACEEKISLPIRLWRLSQESKDLLARCTAVGVPGFIESAIGGLNFAEDFRNLHSKTDGLAAVCRKRNLTTQTATAGSLGILQQNADEFLDLAELIEIAMDPRTSQHFDEARGNAETEAFTDLFTLPS